MKLHSTLLLPFLPSVLAAGFWDLIGWHNDFSRGRINKLIRSFPYNVNLSTSYNTEKNTGCPDLKSADITLASATGESAKKPSTTADIVDVGEWQKGSATWINDINEVSYAFYVNGGQCGIILIDKKLDRKTGRYEWVEPTYMPFFQAGDSISKDELVWDSDQALVKGKQEKQKLRDAGFMKVELGPGVNYGRDEPVYVFSGPDGSWVVQVGAKSGNVY